MVVLEGKVIERIKGDDYRFRDSTGVIEVEIDDHVFKGQTVSPDTLICIEAEVDTEIVGEISSMSNDWLLSNKQSTKNTGEATTASLFCFYALNLFSKKNDTYRLLVTS